MRCCWKKLALALVWKLQLGVHGQAPPANASVELSGSDRCSFAHCTDRGEHCDSKGGFWYEPCTCSRGTPRLTHVRPGRQPVYEYCCQEGEDTYGSLFCGTNLRAETVQIVIALAGLVLLCCGLACILAGPCAKMSTNMRCAQPPTSPRLQAAFSALEGSPSQILDGAALHRTVPPERWCVSLQDILEFGELVKQRILDGHIQPSELDPFDVTDFSIGPSIHTVCSSIIKPITAAVGCPSWALMQHPPGLQCDVFFTHGWDEGVFEFVSKAVNSWPSGAEGAYVCFLSNPQNLDISDLITSPSQSPFAKALASAGTMIVIPNRKRSIYTRIWCAYEAFLAYNLHKSICVGRAPRESFRAFAVVGLNVGSAGLSLIIFAMSSWAGLKDFRFLLTAREVSTIMLGIEGVVYVICRFCCPRAWWASCFFGAGAIVNGMAWTCLVLPLIPWRTSTSDWAGVAAAVGISICCVLLQFAVEADRSVEADAVMEAGELQAQFTGRVCDAQSSVAHDKEAIMSEINQNASEDHVDQAVEMLLTTGLHSANIRKAQDVVGHLRNLSSWSMADVVICCLSIIICTLFIYSVPIRAWCFAVGIVWFLSFTMLSRDKCAFAASVSMMLCIPAGMWEAFAGGLEIYQLWGSGAYAMGFLAPLAIALSVAGPGNVARLPVLGPFIVKLLLGREPFRCWQSGPKQKEGTAQTDAAQFPLMRGNP